MIENLPADWARCDKIAYMAFETLIGKGTPGSKAKEGISKALGPQAAQRLERLQKLAR